MSLEITNANISKAIESTKENVTVTRAYNDEHGNSFFTRAEAIKSNLEVELVKVWDNGSFRITEFIDNADVNELNNLVAMGKIAEQILRQKEISAENKECEN